MIPKSIASGDFLYALALSGCFAGIFLLVSTLFRSIVIPWRRRREVSKRVQDERLTQMARAGLFRSDFDIQKTFILRAIEKVFGWERLHLLRRTLFQADIYTSLPRFLNIVILCACAGFMVGWYFRNPFLQLALGIGGGFLPFLYLRQRQRRKARLIEQQLPDTMELLARSLLSGHTLPSAVDLASQEIPAPLGTELRLAHEEQRLGLTMPEALENMAGRTTSRDLRYFVAAINIQHEVGGNLAEVMHNISSLIRGRLNLKAKVLALTSSTRLSATFLAILPFVIFFLIYKVNPGYAGMLLTDPLGHKMLALGLILLGLGTLIMRKMADLKV